MNCQTVPQILLGALLRELRTSFLPLRNFSVSQAPGSDPSVMHENSRIRAREPGMTRRALTSLAGRAEVNIRGGGKKITSRKFRGQVSFALGIRTSLLLPILLHK